MKASMSTAVKSPVAGLMAATAGTLLGLFLRAGFVASGSAGRSTSIVALRATNPRSLS
ncbi:MAG: hypothetical protein ACRDYA_16350 [Egibacteraceae bacterium]